jgi:hypothetical protein
MRPDPPADLFKLSIAALELVIDREVIDAAEGVISCCLRPAPVISRGRAGFCLRG